MDGSSPAFRLICLVGLLLCQRAIAQSTCYFPNGTIADSYSRCSGTSNSCCYNADQDHHDLCYNNGFCYSMYFGYVYRGACTDQNWGPDSGCASQCLDVYQDTYSIVTSCGGDAVYPYMCCGSATDTTNCCGSSNRFSWENATFGAPTTSNASSCSTSGGEATVTVAPLTYDSKTADMCKSSNIALGASLGVPLGICALSTLGLAILLYRSHSQARRILLKSPVDSEYDRPIQEPPKTVELSPANEVFEVGSHRMRAEL